MIHHRVANENDFDTLDPNAKIKFRILKIRRRVALVKTSTFQEQTPGNGEIAGDKHPTFWVVRRLPKQRGISYRSDGGSFESYARFRAHSLHLF